MHLGFGQTATSIFTSKTKNGGQFGVQSNPVGVELFSHVNAFVGCIFCAQKSRPAK